MSEVTVVLQRIDEGDAAASADLLPLVYDELRRLAERRMRSEAAGNTLQPTALVHEAYVRLVGPVGDGDQRRGGGWDGRGHFFAAAAEAMRRILIESARRRSSLKRGGDRRRRDFADADAVAEPDAPDRLLDMDAALTKLADEDPDLAKLVELRFFAGLSVEDTATALGVSPRTVKRHWTFARAWLGRELGPE